MGHKSTSMDDRYTMTDDKALDDAWRKMEVFRKERGLLFKALAAHLEELRAEVQRLEAELGQK